MVSPSSGQWSGPLIATVANRGDAYCRLVVNMEVLLFIVNANSCVIWPYTSNVDNSDLFEIWYVNGPNVSLFGYKISGKSDKVKSIFTLPVKSSPLTSENNALSTTVIR